MESTDANTTNTKGFVASCISAIRDTASENLNRPRLRFLGDYIFHQPAIYVTLVITFTYMVGYFGFSVLWCFVITTTVGSTCKVLLKRKIRNTISEERKFEHNRIQTEKESCEWLNNILTAVYGNHNLYISHLFVRFASPLLNKMCTPPPIESVEFRQLDVTTAAPRLSNTAVYLDGLTPTKNLNYDFDVEYNSTYNGIVVSKLARTPELPVFISNLKFKCRMRFSLTFAENRFPFISSLRWSLLRIPEIDISVKAGGLPGMMEMPSITVRFLELVRHQMYAVLGHPKFVEANFTKFIHEDASMEDEVARFIQGLTDLIPEMIKHGSLTQVAKAPEDALDPDFPVLGVMSSLSKAMKKVKNIPTHSTPTMKRRHMSPFTARRIKEPTVQTEILRSNSDGELDLLEIKNSELTSKDNLAEEESITDRAKTTNTPKSPVIPREFHSRRLSGLVQADSNSFKPSPPISRVPRKRSSTSHESYKRYSWDSSDSPSPSPQLSRSSGDTPSRGETGPKLSVSRAATTIAFDGTLPTERPELKPILPSIRVQTDESSTEISHDESETISEEGLTSSTKKSLRAATKERLRKALTSGKNFGKKH